MEEVKENPWSEICWYMPESREQYRLSGKLYIIKSDEKDEQLKKVWHHSAALSFTLCMHSYCSNRCCDGNVCLAPSASNCNNGDVYADLA